jgi:hypothetical protein
MRCGRLWLVAALVALASAAMPVAVAAPADPQALPSGAGAPLEMGTFRYARDIPAGKAGLCSLELDALVLGHSQGYGLGDVRLATPDGRQIPYVLEQMGDPLIVRLPPLERIAEPAGVLRRVPRDALGSESYYRLRLPAENLNARLVLRTGARVFERHVEVGVEQSNARRNTPPLWWLANATWRHDDASAASPPLTMDLPRAESRDLVLVVDEGDNQPLPIAAPEIELPRWRLRFVRASGAPLLLLYGRRDMAPPRYDLALSSPDLPTGAEPVAMGLERPLGPAPTTAPLSPLLFWGVLIAAVGVLLGMVARLLKG